MNVALSREVTEGRRGGPVARRHVFYISGFDPRGARHYHDLYRAEAPKQATVGGYSIEVGGRRRVGAHGVTWDVVARFGEREVASRIEYLAWDDIVRARWARSGFGIARAMTSSFGYYLFRGVVARVLAASWPFVISMSLGFLVVAGVLLAAAGFGYGLAAALGAPWWGALLAALTAAGAAASQLHRLDARLNAFWLGRTGAFVADDARTPFPDYEERQQAFAARLVEVVTANDGDEVLVIGHSVGAQMAISVMARALEGRPGLTAAGPAVGLVTLGSTAPTFAFCPHAARFRADVAAVANAPGLTWIDVGAPPDAACLPLVDPVVAAGARARPDPGAMPKLVSPRFHDIVAPEMFRAMRKDRKRMHFQYLMAADKSGPCDYFAITAGPETLATRFARVKSETGFTRLALFK